MFALAFLAAGALIWKRLGEIGKPVDWAYEMGFAALVGGIVGSRVYFLVQNYERASRTTCSATSSPARAWSGTAARSAAPSPSSLWAWYRDFLGLALLDLAAPALALGYAIGRCGCQLSGDGDYGKPWNGPWAMSYPNGTVPTDQHRPPDADLRDAGDGPRRLDPLAAARPRPGRRPLRDLPASTPGPSASWSSSSAATPTIALGLTTAQLESLAMMVAGTVWIAVVERRHGSLGARRRRRDPAA